MGTLEATTPTARRESGGGTAKGEASSLEGRPTSGKPAGGSGHAESAVTGGTPSISLPDAHAFYLQNPKPEYPARSRLLREEGKVVLRVWVGADGLPTKAEVATSSGYERLNAAALRAVMDWRFTPGKRNGQAQAMEVLVPMPFRLVEP